MNRISRLLAWWFPSVPPADQARILAAMEGRTLSPAPDVCGEAAPGAGHIPEGEVTESSLVTEAYLYVPRPPVSMGAGAAATYPVDRPLPFLADVVRHWRENR